MVKNIHKYRHSRYRKTAENSFDTFYYLYPMEYNQINNIQILAYTASGEGLILNILSHNFATKVVDRDMFEISIAEELDKMIKKSKARLAHSVLRSIWSHR